MGSSRIPGFYKLDPGARLQRLAEATGADVSPWTGPGLTLARADTAVENAIATFGLPCGVVVNLLVNGVDRVVPMVVEEPSVVAAASNMARLARRHGGFTASADPGVMIGQVQLADVADPAGCAQRLEEALPALEERARRYHPELERFGGGLRGMEVRTIRFDAPGHEPEDMVVLHFHLDCADAMGANMVNTIAEGLAPEVERVTGERVGLRILSNLADRRLARARVEVGVEDLGGHGLDGPEVARRIASAWRFAWADPHRAATHNKGVMNGIDPVVIATGNDWRAIEAGAHAWAARDGQYRPLTTWQVRGEHLVGELELPLQLGVVGGTLDTHPLARASLELIGVSRARELAEVVAAVGLAQNLGALRALAAEGIQHGHMRMHARSVAVAAGATGDEVDRLVAALVDEGDYRQERARELLAGIRGG